MILKPLDNGQSMVPRLRFVRLWGSSFQVPAYFGCKTQVVGMYSEEARDDAVMGRTIGVSWHNAQCELPFMTYSCHHFDLRAAAQ